MQPSLFCAIDPGASGAYVIRLSVGTVVEVGDYGEPNDVVKLAGYLSGLNIPGNRVVAVIERVWASPVMGVAAAFAFGENYGAWCMALRVAGIPVYAATPQQWQRVVAPEITGQGAERKRALKAVAVAKFPGLKPTLANCDALLLSEYAVAQLNAGKPLGELL